MDVEFVTETDKRSHRTTPMPSGLPPAPQSRAVDDAGSTELILYACPNGELGDRLQEYFEASRRACGPNLAHAFPPHCTLTGFFHDQRSAVSCTIHALERALAQFQSAGAHLWLRVESLQLMDTFHFLLLRSAGIKPLVHHFAEVAESATRRDALRSKEWLHLSLAYGFPPNQQSALRREAIRLLQSAASMQVSWEVCLFERTDDGSWIRHGAWPLI